MQGNRMRGVFFVLVTLLAALGGPSKAVARTWTPPAGVDSNWFNAANWTPAAKTYAPIWGGTFGGRFC